MILCAMAALVAVAVSAQSRGYENGYRGNVEVEVGTLLDSYLNIGFLTSHGYGTSYGLYAGVYCSPSVGVDMGRVSVSFSYGYSNGRTSLSGNHALLYDRHTLDVGVGIWF